MTIRISHVKYNIGCFTDLQTVSKSVGKGNATLLEQEGFVGFWNTDA